MVLIRSGMMRSPAWTLLCVLFLPALGRADLQVLDLGTLRFGSQSRAYGINDSGLIVGEGDQAFGGTRAISRGPGQTAPTSIGTLQGGMSSQARAVDGHGRVVGQSQTFVSGLGMTTRAFRADANSSMVDLGTLAGWTSSEARAISDTGFVVGTAGDRAGNSQAVRWNPDGTIRAIVGLSNTGSSAANDVDNQGNIVGWAMNAAGVRRAFLAEGGNASPGAARDLGGLTRDGASEANAINIAGDVTGSAQTSGGHIHAFFLSPGEEMIDIHDARIGGSSFGLDISSRGEVVGRLESGGLSRAFYWRSGLGMVDLNSLIAPDSGWFLQSATAINSRGELVGIGTYRGQTRGFLLRMPGLDVSSVPEPSALILAGTGGALCVLLARGRVRRRP